MAVSRKTSVHGYEYSDRLMSNISFQLRSRLLIYDQIIQLSMWKVGFRWLLTIVGKFYEWKQFPCLKMKFNVTIINI